MLRDKTGKGHPREGKLVGTSTRLELQAVEAPLLSEKDQESAAKKN